MKALIVEDNKPVRETMVDILQLMNLDVLYASSAEEALDLMDALESPVDLLISDISLPGQSGSDLYRQVKVRYPTCRVLLTSGLSPDRHDLEGINFLQKPFTLDSLMDNVEMMKQQRSVLSLS